MLQLANQRPPWSAGFPERVFTHVCVCVFLGGCTGIVGPSSFCSISFAWLQVLWSGGLLISSLLLGVAAAATAAVTFHSAGVFDTQGNDEAGCRNAATHTASSHMLCYGCAGAWALRQVLSVVCVTKWFCQKCAGQALTGGARLPSWRS